MFLWAATAWVAMNVSTEDPAVECVSVAAEYPVQAALESYFLEDSDREWLKTRKFEAPHRFDG